jgi:hypothetical protein
MRQRFRRDRGSSMARRPGEERAITLTPRARRLGGWLVAALLVVGIALAVGILGGDGDGTSVVPTPSASGSGTPATVAIAFGSAIDPVTGEVSADATVTRFAPGDAFAYSARPDTPPPTTIYVEVRRTGDGATEIVQPASPQSLAAGARVIAYVVEASALVDDFGTGEFVMRIFTAPDEAPIAEGSFELVDGNAP